MQKTRLTLNGFTLTKACVLGTVLAIVVTFLLAMFAALLISGGYSELKTSQYSAPFIICISVFVGSLIAGKTVAHRRLLSCVAVGGIFLILQSCIALLFFDGISGAFFVGLVSCLIGCGISVFLCAAEKKHSGGNKKRRRSR